MGRARERPLRGAVQGTFGRRASRIHGSVRGGVGASRACGASVGRVEGHVKRRENVWCGVVVCLGVATKVSVSTRLCVTDSLRGTLRGGRRGVSSVRRVGAVRRLGRRACAVFSERAACGGDWEGAIEGVCEGGRVRG